MFLWLSPLQTNLTHLPLQQFLQLLLEYSIELPSTSSAFPQCDRSHQKTGHTVFHFLAGCYTLGPFQHISPYPLSTFQNLCPLAYLWLQNTKGWPWVSPGAFCQRLQIGPFSPAAVYSTFLYLPCPDCMNYFPFNLFEGLLLLRAPFKIILLAHLTGRANNQRVIWNMCPPKPHNSSKSLCFLFAGWWRHSSYSGIWCHPSCHFIPKRWMSCAGPLILVCFMVKPASGKISTILNFCSVALYDDVVSVLQLWDLGMTSMV